MLLYLPFFLPLILHFSVLHPPLFLLFFSLPSPSLSLSTQAYHNVIEQSGQTPPNLPALPYTPDQLYFVAYGQVVTN